MSRSTSARRLGLDKDLFLLGPGELPWAERQPFFAEHGYMLRPRYRADWTPSWELDPTINILSAEDHLRILPTRLNLMDARRISDNKLVLIKKVRSGSAEVQIASALYSKPLRSNPRNHCVPVLDVLRDPQDEAWSYLVMPFLRDIDDPPFESVDNILDCCEQLLEGLAFIHEQGVAHRDCAYRNLMMDADALFPQGFHPMSDMCLPDQISTPTLVLSRRDTPVKYYFVDFGISTQFGPNDTNRLVTGLDGLDQEVPELSDDVPYDPFKVDIFILGNVFSRLFYEKYSNLDVLSPLLHEMLNPNPAERPSAAEALQKFQDIRQGVSAFQASCRPRPRDELLPVTAALNAAAFVSSIFRSFF
ncbi:hypothetical protein ONZ51_g223 [Trametes cubensis]|uniref:Protein kinase domain-containing protein n=1 Tax=Trametes cubensis TaxID=1111947 RepID=A0AAD7U3X3_9APHY|nr:hypothetical protein ONZ51_g223 [Trametes cubensis]